MPDLAVNGTMLHYRFDGPADGPVVMLSNSLASNLGMWDWQVPALAQRYRVLRYDSRGHGRSAPPPGPYSIELLADDARALLDALEISRAHFCGLSKGGMVGQMLAPWHPERLISLVLCDTAAHLPPKSLWDERIKTVQERGLAATVDATIDRWFTRAFQERAPEAVEKVREMIRTTPVEGYAGCCAAIRDMDQRESIRGITVPTLIIVGADDPGTPVAAAELIHERIRGSRLAVLPEAAHFANVEQSERFNALLLEFLAQHDAR